MGADPPVVLALNCGSATVKYLVAQAARRIADGKQEGGDPERLVEAVLDDLRRRGVLEHISAAGHRVVHGGARYTAPVLVDDDVLAELDRLSDLAPLHNPPAVAAIRVARKALPHLPQVATFDTAFHSTLPPAAANYAVPQRWIDELGVHRYGFHGLAHRSLLAGAADQLRRPPSELKLVTFQLGSGCSACAIDRGRSVETSMGLTPNEGLVMRTRSGDVDPTLVEYVSRAGGHSIETVLEELSRESGLAGLAGGDGDMRAVLAAAARGDEHARLALDVYCHRARKYLGAYVAVLGGADAVVFGGGVGENSAEVRERIVAGLDLRVLVVAVDEQAIIQQDVESVLSAHQ